MADDGEVAGDLMEAFYSAVVETVVRVPTTATAEAEAEAEAEKITENMLA